MKQTEKITKASTSLKAVAAFTLIAFFFTQTTIPAPTAFAQNSHVPGGDPVSFSTAQVLNGMIAVPPELGKIEESFQGTSGKTILFIQDAHDSLEAQENIAKLIDQLVKEKGIKTVFEEGYEGPVPTDRFFGFIKDPKIKQKVSYFLLDKLRLGGAEYAHVNRTHDFKLIGVESLKLYAENIKAYQDSSENRKEIEADLTELFAQISLLANQYFPKELKTWLRFKERSAKGELPLLDYLKELQRLSLLAKRSNLAELFPQEYPALSILLAAETTKDKKLMGQLNTLDSKLVFEEMNRLEKELSNALLQNDRDKQIFDYYQGLSLLKRLNQIQLTQSEYDAAKKALQELDTRKLADFIVSLTHKSLLLSKEWERHIRDAVRFYDVAKSRDVSINEYLTSFIENKKENTAALVFGGFHATAIKDLLRQQGISYVVVSPRITKIEKRHQDYYRELMSVGHYPFETPFLVTRANKPPSIYFSAEISSGEMAVRAELRAITATITTLGNHFDSQLIIQQLGKNNASRRSEMRSVNERMRRSDSSVTITGASGDLGAVLTRYIDAKGRPVNALIRSEAGKQKYKDRAVRDLSDEQFVLSDLFDREKIQTIIAQSSVFYHFAALVGLDKDTDSYPENFKINGLAAIGLIKMAEKVNPNLRFIFASTQRVYGIEKDPQVNLWIEHALQVIDANSDLFTDGDYSQSMDHLMNLILAKEPFPQGVYPYELAKLLVERYLERSTLKNVISVRISSLYGPGNLSGRKIQRMIEARLKGQIIEEKREIRDYIYSQDAIEILYQLGIQGNILGYKVIDLASGVETSAEEIWDYIVKHTPEAKGKIQWKGQPIPANPQSNEIGREILGRDFTHIETGIRNQIDEVRWRFSSRTQKVIGKGPVLVIDAGGTSTRMAVWDGEKLIDQMKFPTLNYVSPEAQGKSIEEMQALWIKDIGRKIQEYRRRHSDLEGISMGFAGPVGDNGDLTTSAVIWGPEQRLILNAELQKKWGLPVKVVNDLTAAIYRYGRSPKFAGMKTVALITVSSGIGSKLFDVVHGNVVIDSQGRAGEIGHTVVDYTANAIRGEGLKGELNAYASGRGLSNLARRLASQKKYKSLYEASSLKTEVDKTGSTIETIDRDLLTRLLVESIKKQDAFSIQVIKNSINYLVRVLGPFILQNAPDAIVWMGSIVENLGDVYLDELADQLIDKGLYGYTRDDLKKMFVMGKKDDENGLRGAGLMVFDKHGNATEQVVHNPGYVRDSVDPRGHAMIEAVAPNDLQQRNYFTEGVFDVGNPILADVLEKRNVIFVVEKAVADKALEPLRQYIRHYHLEKNVIGKIQVLDGGEKIKSDEQVKNLTDYAQDQKLDRNGIFVVVGGGAVMDMVGMVANQFRRGVKYVRIPTTLLGQVDAAVGVKVGIDYRTAKNFLGAFYPPFATITDTRFLETLPTRQIQGGIAEIIKVALISNPSLFEILEKYGTDFIRDMKKNEERTFIKDAAVELLKHLQIDFFEHNLMRHVDFGHVLAHKFESMTNYELSHGEAVAIDMLMSAYIARERGLLSESDFHRILSLHKKLRLPFYHPALNPDRAWDGLQESKAHKGGRLMMVVPIAIGRTTFVDSLRRDELNAALDFLRRCQEQTDEDLMTGEIRDGHAPMELKQLHRYLESLPTDTTYYLSEIAETLSKLLGPSVEKIVNIASNPNLDPGTRSKARDMLAAHGLSFGNDGNTVTLDSAVAPSLKNIQFHREGAVFIPTAPIQTQTADEIARRLIDKEVFVFDIDETLISSGRLDPEITELIVGLLKLNKTVAFATVRGLSIKDYYDHIRKGEGLGILKNVFDHPDFEPGMLNRIYAYTGVASYKFTFRMKQNNWQSGWFNIEPVEETDFFANHEKQKNFSHNETGEITSIKRAMLEIENSFFKEFGFNNPDQDYEGFARSAKIQADERAVAYFPRTKQNTIENWKLRVMLRELQLKLAKELPPLFFRDLSFRVIPTKGILVVKKHNRKDEAVLDLESIGPTREKVCFFGDEFSSDGLDRSLADIPGITAISVSAPIPGSVQMLQLQSRDSEKGPDRVKRILAAYFQFALKGRSEMRVAIPAEVELITRLSVRYSPQELQRFLSERHFSDPRFIEDPSAFVLFYQGKYYLIYANRKSGKKHLLSASSYAALKSKQIELLASEFEIFPKNNKPEEIFIFPTKWCPLGCLHCIYHSPKPRGNETQEMILSPQEVDQAIDLINGFNGLKKLSIGGGGEPSTEMESVLKIIERINVSKIGMLSAGNWALTEVEAENFFQQINRALTLRKSPVVFELNISADEYHASRIGNGDGRYLRNILLAYERAKSRGELNGVFLHFRGISKDGKLPDLNDPHDPIMAIQRFLNAHGRIIVSEEKSDSKAAWTLKGNIPVTVSYNRLSQKGDADAAEMWKNVVASNEDPRLKSILINYDGVVSVGKYYSGIHLGDLLDIDPAELPSVLDNQIIANALQEKGLKYLIDIAKEYDPTIEQRIFKPLALYDVHAMLSKALALLLLDPKRRLYIELKIIQRLKEKGKVDGSIVAALRPLMDRSLDAYTTYVTEPPAVQPAGAIETNSDLASDVSLREELQHLVDQHISDTADSPSILRKTLPPPRSEMRNVSMEEAHFSEQGIRQAFAGFEIEGQKILPERICPEAIEVFKSEAESLGSLHPEWVMRSILGKTSMETLSAEEVELFLYEGKLRPTSILYQPHIRPGDIQHSNRLKKGVPVTSSNHPISPVMAESLAAALIAKMRTRIDLSEHARKGLYILGKYTGSLVLGSLVANLLKLPFSTLTKRPYAFNLPADKAMVKIPEPHMPPDNPEYFSYMTIARDSRVLFIDDEITSGDVVVNTRQALKAELNVDMAGVGVALQSSPDVNKRLEAMNLPYASLDQLSAADLEDAEKNGPRLIPFHEAMPARVVLPQNSNLPSDPVTEMPIELLKKQNGSNFVDHPFRGMTISLDPNLAEQVGEKIASEFETQLGPLSTLRQKYYKKGKTVFMVGTTPSGILGALPTSRVTRLPLIGAMNRPEPQGYDRLNISDVVNYIGLDGYAYSMFGLTEGDGILLVTGELTDGEEQIRIIQALKQKGVDVLGVVALVENTKYQGRKKIQDITGLKTITLKKYDTNEGVYTVNRTPSAFAAIKYAVMRLEEAVKKINPNASVKSVRVLHSSLTGGWMIPDSDIDEGYIWVDGVSQFELSQLQKQFGSWLEAGGFRFEGLNNKAPILLSLWHQEINEKTYELSRFPYVEIYRDGQFFDSKDLVNLGIMAFSKPAQKTMARIKWLFSVNEIDENYLRKLLQLVREKASWRPDQIQAFADVIDNLENDRLSPEALECLDWIDQVYLTKTRELRIPAEKSGLFLRALPELLQKDMVRIYGDKLLLVWRHGTAIWSDRFWTDQMRVPGYEKFLEEAQREWYESLPASLEIRENYEQVISRAWEPGMSPLLAEYTMRSWIGRSKPLTDEEKKRWWESLTLTNAIVWGAAIEVAGSREMELKEFIFSTVHGLLSDPQTASRSQLYLYLSLNLMFRWMKQRSGAVDEYIGFILDELVKDSDKRKVPTMVLQDLAVLFANVYERISDPAIKKRVCELVLNQRHSFKDRARRFGEKAFQIIAEKSREDIVRSSTPPVAQNIPADVRDQERKKLFDEFEERRRNGRSVEFLVSDWDSSLVSAKSGQENKIDPRMALWLNWLLSKGKRAVISTAASYTRFYQQAMNPSANRIPLRKSDKLNAFNDTVAFLNDRPVSLRKFTPEFQARLVAIMQDRGWNFLDDGRPPQIAFWRSGLSYDDAVREAEDLRRSLPQDQPVYLTLSRFRQKEWIIKLYYATKEDVYKIPLADGVRIDPVRAVVMGDDGGALGNDAPLFQNALGAFKINLGTDTVNDTLSLETKNEQAALLVVEAWVASNLLGNPGEMFSWEGLAYQLEQDYHLDRAEIDAIIAPVKKLVEYGLAKQRDEEDILLKDAVTKSHGMRISPVYFIEIHPSNRCNLNCKNCIAGKRHKVPEFPFAQLDRVGALRPSELLVIGGGEPTLYSESGHNFNDFILKLAEVAPQADIGLGTNGVLVPPGDWTKKIKWVSVSLHGVNREDFKQFAGQDKFEVVWNNIFNVYALQSPIKDIKVSFVYNGDNFHEILPLLERIRIAWEDVTQKLSERGVKKNFWFFLQAEASDQGPDKPFSIMSLSSEKKHAWAEAMDKLPTENPALWAFIKEHAPYLIAGPLRERQKEPAKMCWIVSNYLLLAATGKIYPCCLMPASAPKNHLGDIAQPLEELLKNRQMLMWAPPKRCRLDCHIRGTLSGMTVKKQLLTPPPANDLGATGNSRSEMRAGLPMERRSTFSIPPGATREDLLKLATKVGADLTFGEGNLPVAGLVFKAGFNRMPMFQNPDLTGFVRKKDTLWFSHFVDNAIDAIADRAVQSGVTVLGQISLRLSREGTNTVLELNDNGTGFSKTVLDKVNPDERFTTKPEREKNLRIGGYGAALSTIPNVVSDRRGIVDIETRTMVGASWKRTVDYRNGSINAWSIPSQSWDRSEQGTTIRWTIPDLVQAKGADERSATQLEIGAPRAVVEQVVEEELARTRDRYVQKALSDPEIQDLAKVLGLSDVVLRERLESIRKIPEKRDEHIHLGGSISTPGIRRIARWINNQELTKAEREKFWDSMWRIPSKDGTLIKRFDGVETPEKMREIILDEKGEDLDFKTLSKYVEHNREQSSLAGKNGLENFLDRSYSMGSVLLNTSAVPERFLKRVTYLIMEDVAMTAVQENVKTVDLRIKADRTLNRLEAQHLHFLLQSAREVEALLLRRGSPIKINFVFSFSRKVDARVKNIIVKMDIAIQNFIDRLFRKLHMLFGWKWLENVHFNWLNGYTQRAVKKYIDKDLLDLLKGFPKEELEKIIGIDLTGAERVGAKVVARNMPYINYFLGQLEGIKKHKGALSETVAYAHAGEDFETATEGLKMIQVIVNGITRGKLKGLIHGTALAYVSPRSKEFKGTAEMLARKGIPLFISLSTNRETGVLDRLTRFPVQDLENAGVTLIPSTDDPRCSKTTLSIEKFKLELLRERSTLVSRAKTRQESKVLTSKTEPEDSVQKSRSEIRQLKTTPISNVVVISTVKAQAERVVQSVRKNTLPATVFVDAEDWGTFSEAQKQEYFFVALSNQAVQVVVYNERGKVQDKDLTALLKLERVKRTEGNLDQTVRRFANPYVPAIQLSKEIVPSAAEIRELGKTVSFFKSSGNKSGTLATALLWAISGGAKVRMPGVREENGFWTVEESLLDSLQRTYENNFVIAIAA